VEVTVDDLILAALSHSEHVRAIRQAPLIWQEEIVREKAAFDLSAFVDSRWRDISEPVGNTLTTGGPPRLSDHDWRTSAGLRKRTAWGGSWELSQRIGLQDTNSVFFVPDQQGLTRFSLSFTQPLLRNRGRAFNQGLIVIAETNTSVVHHTMVERLEDHLLETAKAYWRLVLHRETASQRRRHLAWAEELAIELGRRRELDLLRNQLLRAQAAVAARQAALARSEAEVRNSESEIARLTGNASWSGAAELIPVEPLAVDCPLPATETALEEALTSRVEIAAAMERVRQAEVRLAMSRNELMPALNLVFETYLMGLEGDYDLSRSLNEQFTDGAPSYTAGLIFEMPLGNRAAEAGHRRRRHEAAQVVHELHAVLADTRAEVEKAVQTAQAAREEMAAKAHAVAATEAELNYLQARWRALQGVDGTVSFLLTDMLDAQDRLMQAETELSHARYAWAVSLLELKRATGELMSVEP
jgi:outer membrane protein